MSGDTVLQFVLLRSSCLPVRMLDFFYFLYHTMITKSQDDLGSEARFASDGASSLQLRVMSPNSFVVQIYSIFILDRYYGIILPCIFNLVGMCGFGILSCILGGQTLAAVADNNLSWTYVCLSYQPHHQA